MDNNTLSWFDPCEQLIASGVGNLKQVEALAVLRSEPRTGNYHGPSSTRETVPVTSRVQVNANIEAA